VTYPNVLVLDYLKSTKQATPELQMQAEQYIAQGYQRLLTFEVSSGGFSLMGNPPAWVMLSAYGLMQLNDMSRVHYVDPAFIERTARWLMEQQRKDSSWPAAGVSYAWQQLQNSDLPVTAYVVWTLIEAGYEDEQATRRGLDYVADHLEEAEDPYVLALIANALVADSPDSPLAQGVLKQLESMKIVEEDRVYWASQAGSFMGGKDQAASIETTALAAYAFLKAEAYSQTANGALSYLVSMKDSFGAWNTTQATILSLKALLLAAIQGAEGGKEATVRVTLNGEETDPIRITPENADVVHLVTFTDKARLGDNAVRLEVEGKRALMYQIIAEYYLPWDKVPEEPSEEKEMIIKVSYDRTELAVNDAVTAHVWVRLLKEGTARMVLVDLGVPPGFTVLSEDLDRLVEQELIARYELAGRQVIVYLENLSSDWELKFSYRLRARYPLKAKTPRSTAYDYYTPDTQDVQPPEQLVVKEVEQS
jgi:hypothetical protein